MKMLIWNSIKQFIIFIYHKIKNAYIYHGYKEYCGKWDSDHWPVIIDLAL
jgi:hypothetical protein